MRYNTVIRNSVLSCMILNLALPTAYAAPPGDIQPASPTKPAQSGQQHWAYQPVRRPDVPAVQQKDWVRTPIDAFILTKLEERGLQAAPDADRATLRALQRGREWIWIAGNHDPDPAACIGGSFCDLLACDPVVFRHAPRSSASDGEIAGHLHPVARVAQRGRTTSRRCFAADGRRLVMPAFGAYTGGLNVRDRAFADVFGTLAFTAHMLGERRLYAIAARRCRAD